MLTKSRGAKRGANGARHEATQGDVQRRSVQLAGTSGDGRRRPATVRLRLASEKPVVRTHLRPLSLQLDGLFEALTGDTVTTAGNPAEADIVWVSGLLPCAAHDLTAARIWRIVRELRVRLQWNGHGR